MLYLSTAALENAIISAAKQISLFCHPSKVLWLSRVQEEIISSKTIQCTRAPIPVWQGRTGQSQNDHLSHTPKITGSASSHVQCLSFPPLPISGMQRSHNSYSWLLQESNEQLHVILSVAMFVHAWVPIYVLILPIPKIQKVWEIYHADHRFIMEILSTDSVSQRQLSLSMHEMKWCHLWEEAKAEKWVIASSGEISYSVWGCRENYSSRAIRKVTR